MSELDLRPIAYNIVIAPTVTDYNWHAKWIEHPEIYVYGNSLGTVLKALAESIESYQKTISVPDPKRDELHKALILLASVKYRVKNKHDKANQQADIEELEKIITGLLK